ncbi:MAG: hypothetical protein DCC49_00745 [Acidobacteria bacterium]|nr:MAG: hypothetical protein DCC49_00745 [Acidobacteriota bacterium]
MKAHNWFPLFRRRLRVAISNYFRSFVRVSGPLRATTRLALWLAGSLGLLALIQAGSQASRWWLLTEAALFLLIVTGFAGFAYEWNLARFDLEVTALEPDENCDIGLLVANRGSSGAFRAWAAHAGIEGIERDEYPDGDAELVWSNQSTGTEELVSGRTKRLEVVKWIGRCGQRDQIAIIGTQRVPDPKITVYWPQTVEKSEARVHLLIAETAIDVYQRVTVTIECSHDGKPPTVSAEKDGDPIPGFGFKQLP